MAQAKQYDSHAQRQAAYRQRTAQDIAAQLQAKGLPALPAAGNKRGEARWRTLLTQAHWALQTVATEMQDYFDQRTETWQESERGESFQERQDEVQELCDALEQYCTDNSIALVTPQTDTRLPRLPATPTSDQLIESQ